MLSAVGLFIAVAEPSSACLDHRRGTASDLGGRHHGLDAAGRGCWSIHQPGRAGTVNTGSAQATKHEDEINVGDCTSAWSQVIELSYVPIMSWTLQSGRLIVVIVHRGDSRPDGQDVAGPRPGGAPDPGRRNQDLDGQDYLPD